MVKNHVNRKWAVILATKVDTSDFVFDQALRALMFGLYVQGASSTQVAVEMGLTRTQFNSMRKAMPDFDEYCEYGENTAQAFLEEIALRGVNGEIRNFNNTMLQFLLKSQYPETYDNKKDDKQEGDSLLEKLTAGSLTIVRDNQ